MSVTITHIFTAGTRARAAEVNRNFQDIAGKFTEGMGGISNADIASGAGIVRDKLSSIAGSRITQAQMDDDAVDSRVLKDDIGMGAPGAAVGTAAHIKDGIITSAKLVDNTIANAKLLNATILRGKLKVSTVDVVVPVISGLPHFATVSLGVLSANVFPVAAYSITTNTNDIFVTMRLHLDVGTDTWQLRCSDPGKFGSQAFTVRVWFIHVT